MRLVSRLERAGTHLVSVRNSRSVVRVNRSTTPLPSAGASDTSKGVARREPIHSQNDARGLGQLQNHGQDRFNGERGLLTRNPVIS